MKNVGSTDRFIRVLVGVAFLLQVVILEPSTLATVILTVLGITMLYSSYSEHCPLYSPLDICTVEGCACKECAEESAE